MPTAMRVRVDDKKILRAVDKAAPRILKRQGAYVRQVMRRGIKVRTTDYTPANPGQAPFTHNRLLKNSILYGVQSNGKAVVVGPTAKMVGKLGRAHEFGGIEIGDPIPHRKTKKRTNWKPKIGGSGPIAIRGGKPIYAILHTDAQVERSRRIAESPAFKMANADNPMYKRALIRKYPKRPFAKPALVKSVQSGRLDDFYRDSIKG